MALAAATRIPAAESTIEFLSLRPVDLRTKSLILASALCGPLFGWALGLSTGRGRSYLAGLAASLVAGTGLLLAGVETRPAVTLAVMSGLQAATVKLLVQELVSTAKDRVLALFACLGLGAVALIPIFNEASGFIGALLPTFWMGDILVAEQFGQESLSAGFVGLCLHLLPLCMALGLTLSDTD